MTSLNPARNQAMAEASAVVVDGFRLRSDARIVSWPNNRYMGERGREFWGRVISLLPTEMDNRPRRHRPIPGMFDLQARKVC
jgi:hypothetical protein